MIRSLLTILILTSFSFGIAAQGGYHFGMKGGLTFANQTWNDGERRIMLTNHINVFVETRDLENKGSLFAQIGLHARGSGIRFNFLSGGFGDDGYLFRNVSLLLGAKRKVATKMNLDPYYFMGIRAEYTLNDNLLDIFERYGLNQTLQSSYIYPDPFYINKFNYGISIGGGLEFQGGKFFNPALEFTVSPDISLQYDEPPLNNVTTGSGQTRSTNGRRIRNITFEISLVLRFLREVIYED